MSSYTIARGTPVKRRRRGTAGPLMVAPFFVLFALVFLVPIGYAIYLSLFKRESSGLGFEEPVNRFVGLGQYISVLSDPDFLHSFGNIALYALVALPLGICLSLMLALLLDTGLVWAGRAMQTLIFLPHAIPGLIAALIWIFLYTPGISPVVSAMNAVGIRWDFFGANEAMLSMVNIAWWGSVGYNMIIFYAALKALPTDMMEAARLDGAGWIRTAISVKLPNLAPMIVFTALFGAIAMIQVFSEPVLLAEKATSLGSAWSPVMYIYRAVAQRVDYGAAAAASLILALVAGGISYVITKAGNRWAAA